MDFLTQQIISLRGAVNRLAIELRAFSISMSNLDSALDKQTEAIRDSRQAADQKQSSGPEVTVLNNLPSSVQVHHNEKDTGNERNYKRFMFLVTTLTLGAIVVYADLVNLQYREMILATQAAQDTLKQVVLADRPWLAPFRGEGNEAVSIVPNLPSTDNGKSTVVSAISVIFHNSGKSPAYIESTALGWNHYQRFPENPKPLPCFVSSGPEVRSVIPDGGSGVSCTYRGTKMLSDFYVFGSVEYTDIRTKRRYLHASVLSIRPHNEGVYKTL
jgi:hypothetical protein